MSSVKPFVRLIPVAVLMTAPFAACAAPAADVLARHVVFFAPDVVRIVKAPGTGTLPPKPIRTVIAKPGEVAVKTAETAAEKTWSSDRLTVKLDRKSGEFSFFDASGAPLLKEKGDTVFTAVRGGDMRVRQTFELEPDEALYGLGTFGVDRLSRRGFKRWLLPEYIEKGMPVIQSVKGWAIVWDETSPVRFSDGEDGMSFESDVSDFADYYFIAGGSIDGNVAGIRFLTGDAPMFPRWTYGYWQSRERYVSQAELLDVLATYRKLGVPVDGMIQDWQYWGDNEHWNAMEFLSPGFPDPQGMVDAVHRQHAHVIISVWPNFGRKSNVYADFQKRGLLYPYDSKWPPVAKTYDAFSKDARDLYWQYLSKMGALGFDGWWMDAVEPEPSGYDQQVLDSGKENGHLDKRTAAGPFRRVCLAYPLMTVGNVHDRQRAARPDRRVFILTRCSHPGQQRFGCNVWSGDIVSSWEALRQQIGIAINFSACGLPHWNSDVGGFLGFPWWGGGREKNPQFHELYVRWMQFGAFTPMQRSHGTQLKRELHVVSKPGEPAFEALLKAIKLHYRILPYNYSLSHEVSAHRASFIRPLAADFPRDRRTWDCATEYLYGRSFLVAPVVEAGANRARPYLPAGAWWWDFRDGRRYAGGTTPRVEAPYDSMPVFVRAGSIVPLGPDVQYADEKSWAELDVAVYPGDDGEYVFYEDEGDGYAYEKGVFSEIPFAWRDAARELVIGDRRGSFPGMSEKRVFTVKFPDGTSRRVDYAGKAVTVRF